MFGTISVVRPYLSPRILPQFCSFGRLQLVRLKNTAQNELHNEKLRQIIESSNLGSQALREQQQKAKKPFELLQIPLGEKNPETSSPKLPLEQPEELPQTPSISEIQDNIQQKIEGLPSQVERARSHMAKLFERYLDSVQDTLFTATRALNDVTGYSAIEKLKLSISELEKELQDAKEKVKECKEAFSDAIQRRSHLQKEVNELLTRKHAWTPEDLERFADLYRNDHVNEQKEATSQEELVKAELAVDAVQLRLTQLILTRYHEEQIWSDKIRRASTWGTWIIMGINMMLFVLASFVVEPWKRRRLVGSFEAKVKQALGEFVAERDAQNSRAVSKADSSTSDGFVPEIGLNRDNTGRTRDGGEGLAAFFKGPYHWPRWNAIGTRFGQIYAALFYSGSGSVQLERAELGVISVVLALAGCFAGSLLTAFFK